MSENTGCPKEPMQAYLRWVMEAEYVEEVYDGIGDRMTAKPDISCGWINLDVVQACAHIHFLN